jgi:hypothetical protein
LADDIPPAVVVQDGKVPGDVPAKGAGGGSRPKYKRRVANYLIDKRLQLRYVVIVTLVSMAIAGTLGYLIYQQEHRASADLVAGLDDLANDPTLKDFDPETLKDYQRTTMADIESRDRKLVLQMLAVGVGLTVILSGYLIIMTHKVAGPLYKVGLYMEQMAEGRFRETTPLRRGDMLQDFYEAFREMHQAVRGRVKHDAEVMAAFATACAAAPDVGAAARDEVDELGKHADARLKSLA